MTETGSKGKEIVVMETSMGTIELAMFRPDAPKTVENFVGLAKKGYYNGLTFHRVIDNFMIQGGDPTATGMGGESIYGSKFDDEISSNLKFDRPGLLAMANAGKTPDGHGTNGSQFFITLVPTPWLNGHHTIFGEVVSGMDVLKAIGKVQTSKPGDKPVTPVIMKKVHIKGAKQEKSDKEKK
ncbi:MAG: peptidylprolyl isomerase [Ignavibacteria bacterium]|nr:peptidylprolyl isomerase [Ignavibacteria bacterium]MBI3766841.1 peptidylprolyl isomerase [Ignavibacteriales bacterium]